MVDEWLVYSRARNAWWRPESKGYCTNIADAGRYSKAQADLICKDGGAPRGAVNSGPYEFAMPAPEALDAATAREAKLRALVFEAYHEGSGAGWLDAHNKLPSGPSHRDKGWEQSQSKRLLAALDA